MKKIKLAIFIAMYVASILSVWFVPVHSIISLAGNRAKYDGNYSLYELEERLLQEPVNTPLAINFLAIYTRLILIWAVAGGAIFVCHQIEKRTSDSKEASPREQQ